MAHISSAQDPAADGPPPFCPAGSTQVSIAGLHPADTDISTAQTVALMAAAIRRAERSPVIDRAAADIARTLPDNAQDADVAAAVFAYVKRRVDFLEDSTLITACWPDQPASSEVLIEPDRLLSTEQPAGDCDDFTMAVCALLRRLGVDCEIVTVAADPEHPDNWSHVYAYALLHPDRRLALDASHGDRPGWEAPRIFRRAVWPIEPPAHTLHGLNGLGAFSWGDAASQAVTSGLNVFEARFGGPRPGTFAQTGPDGSSVLFRQQPGASSFSFPTTSISPAAGGDLLLWGIAAVAVIGFVSMLGGRR